MSPALTLLARLLEIPSVNPMGRTALEPQHLETRLTDFLEAWLRERGARTRRQAVAPGRDNLLATAPGAEGAPHWLWEVHQDTVPADGMTVPPFAATLAGDRVHGRGACDVKGPMAAMLLAFARLLAERPAGAATVTLALAVDEEYTHAGAEALAGLRLPIDGVVVAEPTDFDLVVAHKGSVRWELTAPGVAAHSSAPQLGANAIYRMARVALSLERHAAELFAGRADPWVGPATLSVGLIAGGSAPNTVPDECRIAIDRRVIPGETPLGARDFCRAALDADPTLDFPFHFGAPWIATSPLAAAECGALAERLAAAAGAVGRSARRIGAPYGTDASAFAALGVPAVVFGPGHIAQAHTKDEWISLADVELAAEAYFRFAAGV